MGGGTDPKPGQIYRDNEDGRFTLILEIRVDRHDTRVELVECDETGEPLDGAYRSQWPAEVVQDYISPGGYWGLVGEAS